MRRLRFTGIALDKLEDAGGTWQERSPRLKQKRSPRPAGALLLDTVEVFWAVSLWKDTSQRAAATAKRTCLAAQDRARGPDGHTAPGGQGSPPATRQVAPQRVARAEAMPSQS